MLHESGYGRAKALASAPLLLVSVRLLSFPSSPATSVTGGSPSRNLRAGRYDNMLLTTAQWQSSAARPLFYPIHFFLCRTILYRLSKPSTTSSTSFFLPFLSSSSLYLPTSLPAKAILSGLIAPYTPPQLQRQTRLRQLVPHSTAGTVDYRSISSTWEGLYVPFGHAIGPHTAGGSARSLIEISQYIKIYRCNIYYVTTITTITSCCVY